MDGEVFFVLLERFCQYVLEILEQWHKGSVGSIQNGLSAVHWAASFLVCRDGVDGFGRFDRACVPVQDDRAFVKLLDDTILVLDLAFVDKLSEIRFQNVGALVLPQAAWVVDEALDACFDYFFAFVLRSVVYLGCDCIGLVACCTAGGIGIVGGIGSPSVEGVGE